MPPPAAVLGSASEDLAAEVAVVGAAGPAADVVVVVHLGVGLPALRAQRHLMEAHDTSAGQQGS